MTWLSKKAILCDIGGNEFKLGHIYLTTFLNGLLTSRKSSLVAFQIIQGYFAAWRIWDEDLRVTSFKILAISV